MLFGTRSQAYAYDPSDYMETRLNSYTDNAIILLNFIFTGLHGYQITPSLSTNTQRHRLSQDGDTCCTNPSLSNA